VSRAGTGRPIPTGRVVSCTEEGCPAHCHKSRVPFPEWHAVYEFIAWFGSQDSLVLSFLNVLEERPDCKGGGRPARRKLQADGS